MNHCIGIGNHLLEKGSHANAKTLQLVALSIQPENDVIAKHKLHPQTVLRKWYVGRTQTTVASSKCT